jgi:hypothetical protein
VQITRTTPLRRMTLQLRHIFLTDAETFIVFSFGNQNQLDGAGYDSKSSNA